MIVCKAQNRKKAINTSNKIVVYFEIFKQFFIHECKAITMSSRAGVRVFTKFVLV